MNQGNIKIVKSDRSNYRKYIIIEISETGKKSSIKWERCRYFVSYGLEKIMDIISFAFYRQSVINGNLKLSISLVRKLIS